MVIIALLLVCDYSNTVEDVNPTKIKTERSELCVCVCVPLCVCMCLPVCMCMLYKTLGSQVMLAVELCEGYDQSD